MTKKTYPDDPNIIEAVDNLSSMAEVNIDEIKQTIDEDDRITQIATSSWLDIKDKEKTMERVKSTFRVIHKYLKFVYKKDPKQLKDKEMQRGVQSIISLANEAAMKVDLCGRLFKGKTETTNATETKEFLDLQEFYKKKILARFKDVLKMEQEWQEEWEQRETDAADVERRGLKDLETVTRDKDYELFFIGKENGARFYNKNLLRHIRLVADFDQIISQMTGNDPLVRVRLVIDKEAHLAARYIKSKVGPDLDRWVKKVKKYRDCPLVCGLFRAVIALLLASNHRNLLSVTMTKSSLSYYHDFIDLMRSVVGSLDYQHLVEAPPEVDTFFYESTMKLIHEICFHFLFLKIDYSDSWAFFKKIQQREVAEIKRSHYSTTSIWNSLLEDHESLLNILKKYPSGPLFKVLDVLHDRENFGFDPFRVDDRPRYLFSFNLNKKACDCLRFACPTKQQFIHKVDILPEFKAALRGFVQQRKNKSDHILLINMQDITSWKEFARSKSIQEFQKKAEFYYDLDIVTVAKNTTFYLQADEYMRNHDAEEFKDLFETQLISEDSCGYFFPVCYDRKEMFVFIRKAIGQVHETFFLSKKDLSRKNRLDFIEIIYHLITIKFMMMSKASAIGFIAKDGVDAPSVASASFFAFMKMISSESEWKEDEKELLEWMIFLPALLVRERVVDIQGLTRQVSMLSVVSSIIELNRKKVLEDIGSLFEMGLDVTNIHRIDDSSS